MSPYLIDRHSRESALRFGGVPATDYAVVRLSERGVLRAHCDGGASMIGVERTIDLDRTPILHWSWRVEHVFTGVDERRKGGDDFVARIYAVIDGGLFKWRTRAINYVWASEQPVGASWPNAFRDEAMMVVVQSEAEQAGQWVREFA